VTIDAGQQLLHYRLIEKIGEGGMGVVWKATDSTLGREVAIKILPRDFALDEDRLARFDREARLLASLNHPNIAGIYGIHKDKDTHFLAMELIPGEDLSQRLEQGLLPLEQALRTAREIATGLEAAHENGVIHRDLKPANVKLTADGRAKVLDFGLAKAADAAATASGDPSASPTMTSAGTHAGLILGTASYMSPEQAAGQPIDRRSDIWSFGVVLYELLTGKRLFDGETVSHTLAAVLTTEVDLERLPKETPRQVRQLLRRCLERDPTRRLRDIGEARIILDDVKSGGGDEPRPIAAAPASARTGKERFAWIAVVVTLLAALATVMLWPRSAPERPLVQSTLMPPVGWDFAPASPFAVSPDGRQVAFVANPRPNNDDAAAGSSGIWIRDLASTESRRLADADAESYPFWSPDGHWVGFYADGKLNKIEARGGPVVPICDATDGRGGTWNEAGTIVFQQAWSEALMKVPAGGGTPEPVTTLDKDRFDVAHRWPQFLPDGRHFLFYLVSTTNPVTSEHSGIYVGSLDSGETRFLMKSESRGLYARGHLLYRAGSTLMARPFDASALAFTGDPSPVATDVPGGAISWGGAQFGASEADVLVHMRGIQASLSVLTWRDRDGNILDTMGEAGGYWEPGISHDGTRIAVGVGEDAADIWIYDLERDARTRFTFDPADDRQPLWSPDDSLLAFSSAKEAKGEIWVRPTSGQGEAELLYSTDTNIVLTDWSSDGRLIFFTYLELGDDGWDVWTLDMETSQAEPLLSGDFDQEMARLSPDGKWLAFVSDESGRSEVYVQDFPGADGRWMVSSDGGARGAYGPVWREDGRELYYYRGGSVLGVAVTPGAGFSFGTPQTLFGVTFKSGQGAGMAVTENGQRLLVNELPPVDPAKSGARMIQSWSAGLTGR
jgi:Tol biopolymer transport system component